MSKRELFEGLFWLLLGIGLCLGSLELKLGSFQKPGSGFLPFLTGSFLGLLGAILFFSTLSRKQEEQAHDQKALMTKRWRVLLLTLGALFAYVFLLRLLGFLITTFLFLFFLFKISDPRKWLAPFIFSGSTVILSYFLFYKWLKVQFPIGLFGF